jgi:hypothetical protein
MNQAISVLAMIIILSTIQNLGRLLLFILLDKVISNFLKGVSAAVPYWCGLYSARDSPCDPQQCCCIENLFHISTPYPYNESSIKLRFEYVNEVFALLGPK